VSWDDVASRDTDDAVRVRREMELTMGASEKSAVPVS
jgi:hypothetical protein